jgi:hypothetical protein
MIARVRLVWGDHVTIDTADLDRARQRGRKLIPMRDRQGRRKSRPGIGDLLLHIDNIADGGGE